MVAAGKEECSVLTSLLKVFGWSVFVIENMFSRKPLRQSPLIHCLKEIALPPLDVFNSDVYVGGSQRRDGEWLAKEPDNQNSPEAILCPC
ncbi:MAG TPA: hypothetical protein VGP55_04820 [Chitinophagaceae bacterium]|nr:hypothetical protein [Chitinophagaceae bacterium]